MSGRVTRFLGDSPLRVVVKLIVVSLLVGFVMSVLGWSPFAIYAGLREFALDLWDSGFDAVERFLGYILMGAMIVVPAFLLIRLASFRR